MGLATAMLLAFATAPAHAAGVRCKTTTGDVSLTGTDGSFCEAIADGTSSSKATAKGNNSIATANSDNQGSAKATATGGSHGESHADGKCHAKAKASGAGSHALAECFTTGGFSHATATGGAFAQGSDNNPPFCTANGGTAKVRSTGGNCNAP